MPICVNSSHHLEPRNHTKEEEIHVCFTVFYKQCEATKKSYIKNMFQQNKSHRSKVVRHHFEHFECSKLAVALENENST